MISLSAGQNYHVTVNYLFAATTDRFVFFISIILHSC